VRDSELIVRQVAMLIAVAFSVAVLAFGCSPTGPDLNPVVWMIDGPDSLTVGEQGQYNCLASVGTNGRQLYYTWTCSAGTLSDGDRQLATWAAPNVSGIESLTVVVRNERGKTAVGSRDVTVTGQRRKF
jgi:hypothetical protein